MIKTFGLTHIALPVKDVKRASAFYSRLFGTRKMYADDNFVQVQTPGNKDIIVFEKRTGKNTGKKTGFHFGFRLTRQGRLSDIVSQIEKAGGKIKESGEFVPGEPYVFFYDPDGYEVEIWFEKIPARLKKFR